MDTNILLLTLVLEFALMTRWTFDGIFHRRGRYAL